MVDRIALTIVFSMLLIACGRKEVDSKPPGKTSHALSNAIELVETAPILEGTNVDSSNVVTTVASEEASTVAEGRTTSNQLRTVAATTNAPAKARVAYPAQEIYEQGLAELKRGRELSDRQAGERALRFFREAAEAGNAPAQHVLGVSYLAGIGLQKDVEQGLGWLNKSAVQGYAEAQFKLASLYIRGDLVTADLVLALELARKAAAQGHTEAQYNLGTLYATGKGVTKDPEAAAEWFRKAAEAGHPTAQSNLGVLYASGGVLKKDMPLAIEWWRKAAEQGQPSAQYNLAQALVDGEAAPKDLVEAYKWYHLAADQGDRDAARMRNVLGVELAPEEVAEALKRAREFKAALQAALRERREDAF